MRKFGLLFLLSFGLKAAEEKIIDLGAGNISSEIRGAEYLTRMRESLASKFAGQEEKLVKKTLDSVEERHLQILETQKEANND
jgi:hypothetical protein